MNLPAGPPTGGASGLRVVDWGRTRYADALARQRALLAQRKANSAPDTLVFTEHDPVYTVGVRPGAAQHLIWNQDALREAGIDVAQTNRGGDITYHGPGQIVGYPIVSLRERRDLHAYLRLLEQVLIETVAEFGISANRRAGKTGIWIEDRKIAAIGVAVSSWITYHGFALNVDPDLSHFAGIVPCGITDGSVTSMARELSAPPPMTEVKQLLTNAFAAEIENGPA